jgi:NodT family efflux transporter outer membrane factor (OMF) lipoprotein
LTRIRNLVALALGSAALVGCTVGPDYHAPDLPVPAAYEGQPPAGATIDPATWWRAFGDTQLDALIEQALATSPDVAIAASRVREARLAELSAESAGKPTIDATANANHIHFSKNAGFASLASLFSGNSGAGSGGGSTGSGSSSGLALPGDGITTFSAGFDANWEIDLFGGSRRGVEAARARAEAAVWNRRDAAVMLAAEIADTYFALRLDQQQAAILDQQIADQRRALQISAHIAQVGLVPPINVTRQNASITSLVAAREPIVADTRVRAHALAVLLGKPPEALTDQLLSTQGSLGPAPVVPPGLPSDLLRRRPDVRAAERQLAASTADIGVAVADLYPKFNLTGVAELISSSLANLLTGNSFQWTAAGGGSLPVLDWGRRRATVGMRREERQQAFLTYQKTVLGALRDVEDPLAQIDAERRRNATLRQAVTDSEATERAIEAQYKTGFVAQDSLLNAQANVLDARRQVAQSDTQLRQETAALFKALGGGWETLPESDEAESAKALHNDTAGKQ